MNNILGQNKIIKVLDYCYDKAVNGLPGCESAEDLANDYLDHEGTLGSKINSLIRWQVTKCAVTGFLSGLGGLMTMPVTVPANFASVIYIQLRMIAAIAHMCGYDIRNDRVRTLAYVCICGDSGKDILKNIGIQFGRKMTQQTIKKISFDTIKKINQKVGFRLITKFGQKGIFNLGKAIPLLGGVIGGSIEGMTTKTVGIISRNTFLKENKNSTSNSNKRETQQCKATSKSGNRCCKMTRDPSGYCHIHK